MRLSELLGRAVVDAEGVSLGGVGDVVLVQDGPSLAPGNDASYRVAGLVVVERRHVRLLGYEREVRPIVFRFLVRRLAGSVYNVPWADVERVESEVRLRVSRGELVRHRRAHRR